MATRAARSWQSSLRKTLRTWLFAVSGLMTSWPAISALLSPRRVLQQESGRACAQRAVDVLVEVEGREDEHAGAPQHLVGADDARRFEPVDLGMRMSISTTSGTVLRARST